jgi:hypothetical protein
MSPTCTLRVIATAVYSTGGVKGPAWRVEVDLPSLPVFVPADPWLTSAGNDNFDVPPCEIIFEDTGISNRTRQVSGSGVGTTR